VARVLIVGAPERGEELARAGHVVDDGREIDPDRLATLTPRLESVSVVCWLFGEAAIPALHGDRLASLLEYLVDTPVRGFVYERSAAHPAGVQLIEDARARFRLPSVVVSPGEDLGAAVERVLGG
jgi:hypothetical protein